MSPEKLREMMEAIAFGLRVSEARRRFGISRWKLRKLLRADPHLKAQFTRATKYAKRRRFPALVIEEILEELARTSKSLKEIVLSRGLTPFQYTNLTNRLLNHSPEWRPKYLSAKNAQNLRLRARLFDEAMSRVDSLGSRAEIRESMSAFNRQALAIHKLTPLRARRAEARARRAAAAADDPRAAAIDAARQRAQRRRPV